MAKLNSEKWKKSSFYNEKSMVGLTPVHKELVGEMLVAILEARQF
jgi:hypothetical protein